MNDKKMSDVLKVGVFFGDTILRQGTGGALNYDELHKVCNNHNNHDRLTEENKQLKQDRDNAISKMSKSWQHNSDDRPNLISDFVDMANRQFEENKQLRDSNEKSSSWCVDIFNDFSESEIQSMSPSIIGAWNRGKQLLNK